MGQPTRQGSGAGASANASSNGTRGPGDDEEDEGEAAEGDDAAESDDADANGEAESTPDAAEALEVMQAAFAEWANDVARRREQKAAQLIPTKQAAALIADHIIPRLSTVFGPLVSAIGLTDQNLGDAIAELSDDVATLNASLGHVLVLAKANAAAEGLARIVIATKPGEAIGDATRDAARAFLAETERSRMIVDDFARRLSGEDEDGGESGTAIAPTATVAAPVTTPSEPPIPSFLFPAKLASSATPKG